MRSCYKYNIENVSNYFLIKTRMCHLKDKIIKSKINWAFVFLDPRALALILGPKNISRKNWWIKHITYSRLYLFKTKTLYLLKIFKKLFRKAKLLCPKQIERLFITVVLFIRKKTLWWNTCNKFTISQSVPIYKPETCSIYFESFSP